MVLRPEIYDQEKQLMKFIEGCLNIQAIKHFLSFNEFHLEKCLRSLVSMHSLQVINANLIFS